MNRCTIGWLVLVCFFSPLATGASLLASSERHGKETVKKYLVQKKGEEKEVEIDTQDHKKMAELASWVEEGKVEHLSEKYQPNLLALQFDLAVWTVAVFLLLLFILKKMAWGPMLDGLHKREENIRSAIEDARKASEEAKALRDQYQKEMDKAQDKVREILDEARRDAERTTTDMIGKARAEIQAERDRLKREMQTEHDQALQHIWSQAADLASMVSAKAIRRQLTTEDHRRLVDEALAELGSQTNGWKA